LIFPTYAINAITTPMIVTLTPTDESSVNSPANPPDSASLVFA
jgi:hypothetical protein